MGDLNKKQIKNLLLKYGIPVLAGVIVLVVVILLISNSKKTGKEEPVVINKPTIERILNVSELSTFEAVYNGVAQVMNQQKPNDVDYYVSYDSRVKAGVDFDKIGIDVDNENKVITVVLPEIKITDVNVDITSLEYIFINDKANSSTVSSTAYKKCIEDATNEANNENVIYELAEKSAKNIVEALLKPFVEQLDEKFEIEIVQGGTK